MTVGTVVVLIDSRGCWTLHRVRPYDRAGVGTFTLAGVVWRSLPFTRRDTPGGPETDREGRPVFRATEPAIGATGAPYSPLYLPEGWHPPSAQRGRI